MNRSSHECLRNTKQIIQIFQNIGFTVHPEPKSLFHPSQMIKFLVFILNSVTMTTTLTNILLAITTNIRTIANILGKTTSFRAAKFGRLHYRGLERRKTAVLSKYRGNYNAKISLTDEAKHALIWWRDNITHAYNNIVISNPDRCIRTDASSYGWREVIQSKPTGGHFSTLEKEDRINLLELKAVLFGLRSLANDLKSIHIKALCDNSTAVACVKKFCTNRSFECDSLAQEISAWTAKANVWLSGAHLPGIQDFEADLESRKQEIQTE